MANTPIGRTFSMKKLSLIMSSSTDKVRKELYGGADLEWYQKAIKGLFSLGWPPACMVSDHNGDIRIFESSYIEGVERAINYGRLCRERDLRDPDCDVRRRDYWIGTGSESVPVSYSS